MSFSFAMAYKPDYQRRLGQCKICHQGIEAGAKIMLGTGYFNKHLIRIHDHYDCWIEEVATRAGSWFFANEFSPVGMSDEQKAKLNRLRAKRYYIQKKGGNADEIELRVAVIAQQIAMVKAQ
ncbi:hypothetical protein LCGC14_0986380 [marine sediment metagenome]|uniref:PARP-type domain-containing protein n=1 Tax=marine sediment metagenome TaxID=412755 RepID=A0A0F9QQI3_9ZZZZ